MKILPLAVLMTIAAPNVIHADDETPGAVSTTASYAATILKDNARGVKSFLQDAGHSIYTKTSTFAEAVGDLTSDIGDGFSKSRAISNGDGVEINARVYSLALRKAEKEDGSVTQLKKERKEREYVLGRAKEEVEDLTKLAQSYKEVAGNSQKNIASALVGIAERAVKLKGWDAAHQKKLDEFVKQHKELGKLTAEDGASRAGKHTLLSMQETWAGLENFIKKSPDIAASAGLELKFREMAEVLEGSTRRLGEKETQILTSMGKVNDLAKKLEAGAVDEEALQRQMILGTLNNSVNNLITSGEFSKVRAQMAFSHFKDIEEAMKKKGVKAGDVKEAYKKNALELASQYNETPFGMYVNGQIAKAMGTVCDLVANQCKDGSNAELFNFLDDSKRFEFKLNNTTPADGGSSKGDTVR